MLCRSTKIAEYVLPKLVDLLNSLVTKAED
jgi:hypothetical protein